MFCHVKANTKNMLYLTPSWKKYSPGASEVPANKLPIITVEAPNETAFMMWPTDCIPPSAITGTPNLLAYSATKIYNLLKQNVSVFVCVSRQT